MKDIDLNQSLFDYCYKIAEKRSKQKEGYKSSNPMSKNYELVGVLGEVVYGLFTGELFDSRLKISGDDGSDFNNGVQVKTSERHKARHLIEYKDKDFSKFKWYVFVIVDLDKRSGEVVGYISVEDFIKKSEIVNFGYGDRYAITLDKLNKFNKF